jgi:hypothetical protein
MYAEKVASKRGLGIVTSFLSGWLVMGCLDHPVVTPRTERAESGKELQPYEPSRDVDVLFVIDNSGSMGDEQGRLAANFSAFVDALEDEKVNANYRIAVVSTEVRSNLCASSLGAKDGEMRFSSCLDRKPEFTGSGTVRFNTACESRCSLHNEELNTLPTTLEGSEDEASRVWIERYDGALNLPDGVDAQGAFACVGPQGIAGCGVESPLEAMKRAIEASRDPDSPNFGFVRQDAILAVIFVTDERDCSASKLGNSEVFTGLGAAHWVGPFWPTMTPLNENQRPDYACFLSGVACEGYDGLEYESCIAANWDVDGKMLDDDEPIEKESVLHPVTSYVDFLKSLPKTSSGLEKDVIVSLIGGVDPSSLEPIYRPLFLEDGNARGLGVGCASEVEILDETQNGTLIPSHFETQEAQAPVRLIELVDAFASEDTDADDRGLYSICAEDYSLPLQKIGKHISDKLKPACFRGCVLDTEPETKILEPECVITERRPSEDLSYAIPECQKTDGIYDRDGSRYVLPERAELCYVYLTDPADWTEDPNDQLDASCQKQHNNLQIEIQREEGTKPPPGASIDVECSLATDPATCQE